jgi:hypothetical protein
MPPKRVKKMDEKPLQSPPPPPELPHTHAQNVSSPPYPQSPPDPAPSPELDFKQKVIVLFGLLITVNQQVLAQIGHATDQHPLLKDAWEKLAALNTHATTAADATPTSPAAG